MNDKEFYRSVKLKIGNLKKKIEELENFIDEHEDTKDKGKPFVYPQRNVVENDVKEFSKNVNQIIDIKRGNLSQEEIFGYLNRIGKPMSMRSIRRRLHEYSNLLQGLHIRSIKAGLHGNTQRMVEKEGLYQQLGEFEIQKSFLETSERFLPVGYIIDQSDMVGITREYVHMKNMDNLRKIVVSYFNEKNIPAKIDERGRILYDKGAN